MPVPLSSKGPADNWSGYAVTGGPFTSVSGTFTVPYITMAATCEQKVSEWVGIDGFGPNDSSLIEAGIDESETDPTTGSARLGNSTGGPGGKSCPPLNSFRRTGAGPT